MASTTQDLVARVRLTLCDPDAKHWADAELMSYLNEAVCEIAGLRPDEFVKQQNIPLVAGACQQVPAGCRDVVSVEATLVDGAKSAEVPTKTTSTSGSRLGARYSCAAPATIGPDGAVTDPCDAYRAAGFSITKSAHGYFTVSPPVPAECADAGITVAALVYCEPEKLELGETPECVMPCSYEAQIIDYMLMRAFEKDGESQYATQRASYYRRSFFTGLGEDYRAASRLRSGYMLGETGDGNAQTGWRNEIRGIGG
jgi:hypothetical protein